MVVSLEPNGPKLPTVERLNKLSTGTEMALHQLALLGFETQ